MTRLIQIDETDQVNEALEANLFSFFTNFGRTLSGTVDENSRLLAFATGIGSPFYNGVFRARLQAEEVEGTIAEVIEKFAARQVPFCWWTSYSTQPANLSQSLKAQGLEHFCEYLGMAIDLSNLPSQSCPDDLEIIRVKDRDALESWLRIGAIGFHIPLELVEDLLLMEESLGFESDRYIRYLALWKGVPVSTSALYLDAGVAGIYFVTTLPQARCKGFATQAVQTALEEAQKQEYQVAILQSSSEGKNVYRRIGFQECFPIDIYSWEP